MRVCVKFIGKNIVVSPEKMVAGCCWIISASFFYRSPYHHLYTSTATCLGLIVSLASKSSHLILRHPVDWSWQRLMGNCLESWKTKSGFAEKKSSDKKTFASEVNNLRSDIWRAVESFFLIKQFPNVGIPSSRVDITIKQMLHPSCWILIFCDFL